jgi:hypothetical protein
MKKVASTFNIMQVSIVPDRIKLCFLDDNLPSRSGFASSMNKMMAHLWEPRSTSMYFQQRIRAKGFRHDFNFFVLGEDA